MSGDMVRKRTKLLCWILGAACLFSAGCPERLHWTSPEAGRFQLALDRRDCEQMARLQAMDGSRFGRREVWGLYRPAFEACMRNRGWTAAQGETANATRPEAAPGHFHAPTPPAGFIPLPGRPGVPNTTVLQGPDGQSLFLALQTSPHGFSDIAPPLPRPFHAFDRMAMRHGKYALRLLVFFGRENNRTVGGVSAYVLTESAPQTERAVFAVSGPLPAQRGSPPPGCRLDYGQKQAMEEMARTWRAWIVRNLMEKKETEK